MAGSGAPQAPFGAAWRRQGAHDEGVDGIAPVACAALMRRRAKAAPTSWAR
jgi:hypothetical protein